MIPPVIPSPNFSPFPTESILGFPIFKGTCDDLIRALISAIDDASAPLRLGYLNAAQSDRAASDPLFESHLASMDLIYADGQSIVWASQWLGRPLPDRLTATDFIDRFLSVAAERGISIALLGGTPGAAHDFARFWRLQIPDLRITYERDGFFDAAEEPSILRSIEQSGARVILVGMGAPRQEHFVARAASLMPPRVWWCVGALFEYGSWGRRRAPLWMRRVGLEWLFRLIQEPRRLGARYLLGNPAFLWRLLRHKGIFSHGIQG